MSEEVEGGGFRQLTLKEMRELNKQAKERKSIRTTGPQKPASPLDKDMIEQLQEKWNLQLQESGLPVEEDPMNEVERQLKLVKERKIPKHQLISQEYIKRERQNLQTKAGYKNDRAFDIDFAKGETKALVEQRYMDQVSRFEHARLVAKREIIMDQNWIQSLAKRGKLGVDYYAIAFGLFGIVALPIMFYTIKQFKNHQYKPYFEKLGTIQDWENAPIDIDDVSKQINNHNLYSFEIETEKRRRTAIHQQIFKLMDRPVDYEDNII